MLMLKRASLHGSEESSLPPKKKKKKMSNEICTDKNTRGILEKAPKVQKDNSPLEQDNSLLEQDNCPPEQEDNGPQEKKDDRSQEKEDSSSKEQEDSRSQKQEINSSQNSQNSDVCPHCSLGEPIMNCFNYYPNLFFPLLLWVSCGCQKVKCLLGVKDLEFFYDPDPTSQDISDPDLDPDSALT